MEMYTYLWLCRDQGGNISDTVARMASSDLCGNSVAKIIGEDLSPYKQSRYDSSYPAATRAHHCTPNLLYTTSPLHYPPLNGQASWESYRLTWKETNDKTHLTIILRIW